MKIGVIGGGAAGFFAAIHAAGPGREVHIYEKSSKLLSKVRISGGGRCNVTHRPMEISKLVKFYPRGEKFLKRVFRHFSIPDTINWFQSRGVALKEEADGRVFPQSDSSESIIQALTKEANRLGVQLHLNFPIHSISPSEKGLKIISGKSEVLLDRLIIAAGGSPKMDGYQFLSNLKHTIVPPIPSLFTFNTPQESIRELMGISVSNAHVRLEGTKLSYHGPVLITHWGVSGPAVLKLSAFGAKWLYDHSYKAQAVINWNADLKEQDWDQSVRNYKSLHGGRKVKNYPLHDLPTRLWEFLVQNAGIEANDTYGNLSKKQINRLVQNLFCYILKVEGKTTFKEEFVTAGGIDLQEVNPETMESIFHPKIFFAGEVLNVDGITGGFNFQAAWSTGYLAGKSTHL
ncbi:NAD(P)/FAD-dependent oxidoreductase [Algoriphagus kandeliae]|uniref:NAD(P)/FAD-dependent oxidoreductase n=1 Tax=Algoriphagus kandeliae TaxID=2562278 RepID=A0A4Y9QZ00_9BACT|nr:NAD(P)/FAD-dependent oxidoreductase [Algoriphagus kandeliae]TFV97639.1 NAD(P)/FAD-dependent oxidoreductase [Algoriphagus kandeliae]